VLTGFVPPGSGRHGYEYGREAIAWQRIQGLRLRTTQPFRRSRKHCGSTLAGRRTKAKPKGRGQAAPGRGATAGPSRRVRHPPASLSVVVSYYVARRAHACRPLPGGTSRPVGSRMPDGPKSRRAALKNRDGRKRHRDGRKRHRDGPSRLALMTTMRHRLHVLDRCRAPGLPMTIVGLPPLLLRFSAVRRA